MSLIAGFHHAEITIPTGGEAAARAFYQGILGLTEVEKPESLKLRGGFWLQLGAFQVHIGIEDGVERGATKAHLAYEVSDLASMRQVITSAGLLWKEGIKILGYLRAESRDPFKNRIEFLQREP
jgi:catechol 2,3-dioxygenase-like lactoylglutathione lyase family enzyme